MRRIGPTLFAALLLAAGCSKTNEIDVSGGAGVGQPCETLEDCGGASVCVLGYCRVECGPAAPCSAEALCLGADPFGCSLAWELSCSPSQPCEGDLVCGSDGRCRMPCAADADCALEGAVCTDEGCGQ